MDDLWDPVGPPPGSLGTAYDYGPVFTRVQESLPGLVRKVRKQRQEAVARLAELRRLAPEERRRAVHDPRFRNPALVELVLETSRAVQRREPAESVELAGLAAALAAQSEPSPDDLAAIFARALGLAANARRLSREHREAGDALERALPFLADRAEWGGFCRGLGLLRWEQGRLHQAAALLDRAAALFQEAELAHDQGTCLALLGLLLTEETAYATALPVLDAALAALETRRLPWLAVRAGLARALTLAETGQTQAARQARAEAWRDYRRLNREEDDLLSLQWLGGKLAARLREREAEALLDAVWRECLRQGRLAEAALVTLDCLAVPEPRRARDLARRSAELAKAFAGREGLELVLSRLGEPAAAAVSVAAGVRSGLRAQGLGPGPLPFVGG